MVDVDQDQDVRISLTPYEYSTTIVEQSLLNVRSNQLQE